MHYRRLFFLLVLVLSISTADCQQEQPLGENSSCPFFVWGFGVEGFPLVKKQLEDLEAETKIVPQIIQFYLQWSSPLTSFPSLNSTLKAISDRGALPSITWEPMLLTNEGEEAIPYEQILKGEYDAYLMQIAQEIKEWKRPLIIRLAHEMNLKRYHWGTSEREYGPQSAEIYRKIFRYVVTLFREQGVKNILWAFCPNVEADPNEPWNKVEHYYPGDDYVDLLGMDGYNWEITPEIAKARHLSWEKPWLSFEQIFQNLYRELRKISPNKPLIVFETSSVDRKGGRKSKWLSEALQIAKAWGVLGIIWFQSNKEEDWRLQIGQNEEYISSIREAVSPVYCYLEIILNKSNRF